MKGRRSEGVENEGGQEDERRMGRTEQEEPERAGRMREGCPYYDKLLSMLPVFFVFLHYSLYQYQSTPMLALFTHTVSTHDAEMQEGANVIQNIHDAQFE